MKIRNGFVSNSSSSSFILKLPHYPESMDDLKRILLGDENPLVLTHYNNVAYPTDMVIEIIYKDILEALKLNNSIESLIIDEVEFSRYSMNRYDKMILSSFKGEYDLLKKEFVVTEKYFDDCWNDPEVCRLPENERFNYINKCESEMNKVGNRMKGIIVKTIQETSNVTDIYTMVSYSDDDGSLMAYLEQGGILDPITVVRISHH